MRDSLRSFEAGTLAPEDLNHEAHVYLAWSLLRVDSLPGTIARFTTALQRLVADAGQAEKYHETITWFYLLQIAERRERQGDLSWGGFRRQHPDLFAPMPTFLGSYYSEARLCSGLARRVFVLPDRAPAC